MRIRSYLEDEPIPDHYWDDREKYAGIIIKKNIAYAKSEAYKFSLNNNQLREELESIALAAMYSALKSFQPGRSDFPTWATCKMKSAIRHHIRDTGPVPRSWAESYRRVSKVQSRMESYGRSVPLAEVAEKLNVRNWGDIEYRCHYPGDLPLDPDHDIAASTPDDDHDLVRLALLQLSDVDRNLLEEFSDRSPDKQRSRSPDLEVAIDRFKAIFTHLTEADQND